MKKERVRNKQNKWIFRLGGFEATYWAKRCLAEVFQELLEQQVGPVLNQHWERFRLVSGVRVRDNSGHDIPIAGIVASDRGIFIGVSPYAIGLDESKPLPKENPAWPFAESVSQHCGIPLECFLAALIVPKESCVSDLGLPFWALRESNLSTVMLNARASKAPDWQAKRQEIIRRLETLPMSSKGAEKNALVHFTAAIPEWEDGAALLAKVDEPSNKLIQFARRAEEELARAGVSSVAANIRAWLEKIGA